MLTREEYEKTLIRMFDSIRTDGICKGAKSCDGADCECCPLNVIDCSRVENIFKVIEIVEEWGKEHPVVTMEDKFVEVFGQRPTDENGNYCCPDNLGLKRVCDFNSCNECVNKFWKSEYIPPKKEK